MDHVKVNIRGMGRIPCMRYMCMDGVFISQNNGAMYIRLLDTKLIQRSQTPSLAFRQEMLVCDHISKDDVTMTIWKLHSQI